MSAFKLKSQLPIATQDKMDAIIAIPSGQRTATEAAFLTAIGDDYIYNAVISYDASGLILQASGHTVPTGDSGFAKGATFIKTDASGNGLYMNTGSTSSASWDLVDQATSSNIDDGAVTLAKMADVASGVVFYRKTAGTGVPEVQTLATLKTDLDLTGTNSGDELATLTPVNAVAASKLLTIGTNPLSLATVSIGGVVYRFRNVIGAGVAATGTLTMNSEIPHDGDTVLMGNTTYTFKTALTPTANEVLAEVSAEQSMDNLIAAIEGGAGEGTKYATGTVSQGAVTASKATADTMLVTYDSVGFLGNQYDTAGTLTHATWGAVTLTGGEDAEAANDVLIGLNVEASIDNLVLAITAGAGEGTNYGTGTVANTLATAVKASAATMTATNKIKGVIGNSTAIAESLADGSWAADATFLSGGVDGTAADAGAIRYDSSYIYVAIAAQTAADANWRRISLGTAY